MNRPGEIIEGVRSLEGSSKSPSLRFRRVLFAHEERLASFLEQYERRSPLFGDQPRNISSARAAVTLLRTLRSRIPAFEVSDSEPLAPADEAILAQLEGSFGEQSLTTDTVHSFLEGSVAPLALLVRERFSVWTDGSRTDVVETGKEMRYGESKWGEERIALDLASNHLPSDSGATNFHVKFQVEQSPGGLVWKDLATFDDCPPPASIRAVSIEDDGVGYPYEDILRENPRKRGATETVGEHGEGLLMAAVASVRKGVDLTYESRDWRACAVAFPQPDDPEDSGSDHGWYLGYILQRLPARRSGSRTLFQNPSPRLLTELFRLRDHLLHYTPHEVLGTCKTRDAENNRDVAYGSILRLQPRRGERDTPKNRVYVKGVYSTHALPTKSLFSYDLHTRTPRDRDYIPDLDQHLLRVFSSACTREMALLVLRAAAVEEGKAQWKMGGDGAVWGKEASGVWEIGQLLPVLEMDCPPQLQEVFKQAFVANEGPHAVLATSSAATERFNQQQKDITKGKKLVWYSKNMTTFLRNACGLPVDWDVVQFPKSAERSTSLTLEAVDIQRYGLEKALFQFLLVHHQASNGGDVRLEFECEGSSQPVTLATIRQRRDLQSKVRCIRVQSTGDGIEEAALRLQVGQPQRREAIYALPDAISVLLAKGACPQLASRNWEATARIDRETVGGREFTSVTYDSERYPADRVRGIDASLTPPAGKSHLPPELLESLLKISDEVCFLEPERFGTPILAFPNGVKMLGRGSQTGLVFLDGQVKFRFSDGRYNYLLPSSAVPVHSDEARTIGAGTSIALRQRGRDCTINFGEFIQFFFGAIVAEHFPRMAPDEAAQFLARSLQRVKTASQQVPTRESAEGLFLRKWDHCRAEGCAFVGERGEPVDKTREAHGHWFALYTAYMRSVRLASDRTVLQNPHTPEVRDIVTSLADALEGKRSSYSRGDHFMNASQHHGKAVLGCVEGPLADLLHASGVPFDTDLAMRFLSFAQRHRVLMKTTRNAILAALLSVPVMAVGRAAIGVHNFVSRGEGEQSDIFQPVGSYEGDSYRAERDKRLDLGNALKALLVGLGTIGVAAAGIALKKKIDEMLAERDVEAERKRDLEERARALDAFIGHIHMYLRFLDAVCHTNQFGAFRVEKRQWNDGRPAYVQASERTILVNSRVDMRRFYSTELAAKTVGLVVDEVLAQIPADQVEEILKRVLHGTLQGLCWEPRRGDAYVRNPTLTDLQQAWNPSTSEDE